MKNTVLILFCSLSFSIGFSQSKKDTVKLDSSHVEKILKMPMDTIGDNRPLVPVSDSKDTLMYKSPKESKDNVINRKSIDDADPKKKIPK